MQVKFPFQLVYDCFRFILALSTLATCIITRSQKRSYFFPTSPLFSRWPFLNVSTEKSLFFFNIKLIISKHLKLKMCINNIYNRGSTFMAYSTRLKHKTYGSFRKPFPHHTLVYFYAPLQILQQSLVLKRKWWTKLSPFWQFFSVGEGGLTPTATYVTTCHLSFPAK